MRHGKGVPKSQFQRPAKNVVGRRVASLRLLANWSQADLALRCQLVGWDVSRDTIARIEGGSRWVGDWELLELARVLAVSVHELYPPELRKFF